MKGLITHEYSATVREAFAELGHDMTSCDLLETEIPGKHYKGSCEDILCNGWEFVGSHPECTYLTNSGVRWLYNKDGSKNIERWIKLEQAVKHFNYLKDNIKRGYIENPIPHKYARDGFYSVTSGEWVRGIGKYTQIIQPWQFGHGETKATCLWLINLPNLQPTDIVSGREQRIWKLPPTKDRWKIRSKTYSGIAKALAVQYTAFMDSGMDLNEWGKMNISKKNRIFGI